MKASPWSEHSCPRTDLSICNLSLHSSGLRKTGPVLNLLNCVLCFSSPGISSRLAASDLDGSAWREEGAEANE